MNIAIVIPARFASSRLPEKMLLAQTGKSLIQHTFEQASKSKLATRVVIATDDERIEKVAKNFGAQVVMTCPNHPTGTDRLSEVVTKYLKDVDIIVNVQGDEPEIEPGKIDTLIRLFQGSDAAMGTLVTPFPNNLFQGPGSPLDPNCVKALLGKPIACQTTQQILGYQALYFSRSLVPFPRDQQGQITQPSDYFLHLGIYSYRPEFLKYYVNLPQGKLEQIEKLEQLRVLEHGHQIVAGIVDKATPGIDTMADYEQFVARYTGSQQHAVCLEA